MIVPFELFNGSSFGALGRVGPSRIFSFQVMMAFTLLTFCASTFEVSVVCFPLNLTEVAKEIFLAL